MLTERWLITWLFVFAGMAGQVGPYYSPAAYGSLSAASMAAAAAAAHQNTMSGLSAQAQVRVADNFTSSSSICIIFTTFYSPHAQGNSLEWNGERNMLFWFRDKFESKKVDQKTSMLKTEPRLRDSKMWSMIAGSVETAKLKCRFLLVQGNLCLFLINLSLLKVDSQRYLQVSILRINLAPFIKFGNCFSSTNIQNLSWPLAFAFPSIKIKFRVVNNFFYERHFVNSLFVNLF